jgi:hypothetical protein
VNAHHAARPRLPPPEDVRAVVLALLFGVVTVGVCALAGVLR